MPLLVIQEAGMPLEMVSNDIFSSVCLRGLHLSAMSQQQNFYNFSKQGQQIGKKYT